MRTIRVFISTNMAAQKEERVIHQKRNVVKGTPAQDTN